MKAQFNSVRRRMCRKIHPQTRSGDRPNAQPRDRHEETVQLIYAHLPPAVVMAAGQHLLAQTNIERRAHQLWFDRGCCAGGALADWLQAECEMLQNLCQALLNGSAREPEPGLAFH
jgi:hypothetical protein